MLESKLQSQLIKEAKKNGWIPLKIIRSNINGIADLILFKQEKVIFVEVKTDIGIVSELQKYSKNLFKQQGFEYYLVRSLNEFKDIINNAPKKND